MRENMPPSSLTARGGVSPNVIGKPGDHGLLTLGEASPIIPEEQRSVVSATPANALPQITPAVEAALEGSVSELSCDGTPYVEDATAWRWTGPGAGEMTSTMTLRRSTPDGAVLDLVCRVTVDPDERGQYAVSVAVRQTTEARLVSGQAPLALWWAPETVLRPDERAAIAEDVSAAFDWPRVAPATGGDL